MQELDPMDVKIIRFLSDDARTPFSHIARNLNISDVAVKKRVEKLMQRGIIKSFRVDLDLKKIGYEYTVFFEIKPDPALANVVFQKVLEMPSVLEAHILVGDYPILVKAVAPSMEDVRALADAIGRMDGVLDMKTAVALESETKPLDISDRISQRSLGAR
ncbi:MAG: Lrp/AsnC family transcriptional regulator, leucine-responsive regulatory protein [Candidatus Diapherotrites archaeon]|nr:Lrp/AsnC family transcriptional regulator, leucine-responsive regulatory protein [Candidatus Diapherotrites archaeon]